MFSPATLNSERKGHVEVQPPLSSWQPSGDPRELTWAGLSPPPRPVVASASFPRIPSSGSGGRAASASLLLVTGQHRKEKVIFPCYPLW